MPQSSTRKQLEWPRQWGRARASNRLLLVIVAFGVAGVVLAGPFAVDYLRRGDEVTGTLGLLGGLTALTMAVSLLPAARARTNKLPNRIRVDAIGDRGRGLRVDVRASWRPLMAVWLLLGVGFLTLRGAISLGGYSTSDDPVLIGLNAGGIAIAVLVASAILYVLFTMVFGRRSNYLAITENGVTRAVGKAVSSISWDDIDRISPVMYANVHAVRISPRPWTKVEVEGGGLGRHELESSMTVLAWHLKIDPPLLLRVLQFYLRNPELRAELTSDASIDRMRRVDFRAPKSLSRKHDLSKPADQSIIRFRSARGLDSSPIADS